MQMLEPVSKTPHGITDSGTARVCVGSGMYPIAMEFKLLARLLELPY